MTKLDLAAKLSGSDEEAGAYLAWLQERTRNLMRHPHFWPLVNAGVWNPSPIQRRRYRIVGHKHWRRVSKDLSG